MSQREITRTIAAGDGQDIGAQGDFIYLHTANLPVVVLVDGQTLTMRAGDKRRVTGGFPNFRVENANATDANIVLIVGTGDYSRQAVTGSVSMDVADNVAGLADVSAPTAATTLVAAANTGRRELHLYSDQTVRWGDSGISATKGAILPAGVIAVIETTAAVYVRNDSGAAANISMTEVSA